MFNYNMFQVQIRKLCQKKTKKKNPSTHTGYRHTVFPQYESFDERSADANDGKRDCNLRKQIS